MRMAVAGGTGVVGRHVVETAGSGATTSSCSSRGNGVDLVAGTGLDGVLDGVDAVVDVTSIQTAVRKRRREKFFGAVTRHLLEAEKAAGVGHHVALSIVGVDRAPYGYYAGKVLQERLVTEGDVPWTILRATQFHEFAGQVLERMTRGPVVVVPRMRSQPVAAREVAARLVELVEAGPSGRVPDLGGPREEQMVDMLRAFTTATGAKGWILPCPSPAAGAGDARRHPRPGPRRRPRHPDVRRLAAVGPLTPWPSRRPPCPAGRRPGPAPRSPSGPTRRTCPRIGIRPAPMDADYVHAVAHDEVWVADGDGPDPAGFVVLCAESDHLLLENVAVDPAYQGRGIGRTLLDLAEQRAARDRPARACASSRTSG